MQQPEPAPPAVPAAPPAPAAPAATAPRPSAITLPDGPIPLDGLPKNAQELQGLRERRDILRDQLDRANTRRSQIIGTLDERGSRELPAEARAGLQQRLDLLDSRILQLERDQAMTERLISNAPARVLAEATTQQNRIDNMVDEDEAIASGFAAFGFGVLLTLLVGRFRRRLARRRAGTTGGPARVAGGTDDPRIDRLTQAVDAIAEEVERIGEGQRFVTQLLAARPEAERR